MDLPHPGAISTHRHGREFVFDQSRQRVGIPVNPPETCLTIPLRSVLQGDRNLHARPFINPQYTEKLIPNVTNQA